MREFRSEDSFQYAYPIPDGYLLTGYGTKQARVVSGDGRTLREMYSCDAGGPVTLSPDKLVFISSMNGGICERSIETGKSVAEYAVGRIRWSRFTPDGRYLLCGHHDKILLILDRSTGQEVYRAVLPMIASLVSLSSDGRVLIFATAMDDSDKPKDEHDIYVWRLPREVWTR